MKAGGEAEADTPAFEETEEVIEEDTDVVTETETTVEGDAEAIAGL